MDEERGRCRRRPGHRGGDVRGGPVQPELPLDVRHRASSPDRNAALVNAVLDALPSPTVLLDPDGIVVMGNSAWTAAGMEHGAPILVGADYYAAAVGLHDDPEGHALVRLLRELAE